MARSGRRSPRSTSPERARARPHSPHISTGSCRPYTIARSSDATTINWPRRTCRWRRSDTSHPRAWACRCRCTQSRRRTHRCTPRTRAHDVASGWRAALRGPLPNRRDQAPCLVRRAGRSTPRAPPRRFHRHRACSRRRKPGALARGESVACDSWTCASSIGAARATVKRLPGTRLADGCKQPQISARWTHRRSGRSS